MTTQALAIRVARYMEYQAEPYVDPTVTASWEAECLSAYEILNALLLLTAPEAVSLTITGGTSLVAFVDATPDIILPTQVAITSGNVILRDYAGRAGPVTVAEVEPVRATAGTPTAWAATDKHIIFNRTPASNTGITVTAYRKLGAIANTAELPHNDSLDEAVAQWIAAYIMEPRAGGASEAKARGLREQAMVMLADRLASAERLRIAIFGRSPKVTSQHGQVNR